MVVFHNTTDTCFVYIHWYRDDLEGLSKEVCLYAGADWLKFVCGSEGGERSVDDFMAVPVQHKIFTQHFVR